MIDGGLTWPPRQRVRRLPTWPLANLTSMMEATEIAEMTYSLPDLHDGEYGHSRHDLWLTWPPWWLVWRQLTWPVAYLTSMMEGTETADMTCSWDWYWESCWRVMAKSSSNWRRAALNSKHRDIQVFSNFHSLTAIHKIWILFKQTSLFWPRELLEEFIILQNVKYMYIHAILNMEKSNVLI